MDLGHSVKFVMSICVFIKSFCCIKIWISFNNCRGIFGRVSYVTANLLFCPFYLIHMIIYSFIMNMNFSLFLIFTRFGQILPANCWNDTKDKFEHVINIEAEIVETTFVFSTLRLFFVPSCSQLCYTTRSDIKLEKRETKPTAVGYLRSFFKNLRSW